MCADNRQGTAAAGTLSRLADFRGLHAGASVVVCGCGESLNELGEPERFVTVGVNDVGRLFQPRHLVVVNPRNQFAGDRFSFVERSRAEYLFTQLDLGLARRGRQVPPREVDG